MWSHQQWPIPLSYPSYIPEHSRNFTWCKSVCPSTLQNDVALKELNFLTYWLLFAHVGIKASGCQQLRRQFRHALVPIKSSCRCSHRHQWGARQDHIPASFSYASEQKSCQGARGLNEVSRARLTRQEAITASVAARAPKIETPSEAWFWGTCALPDNLEPSGRAIPAWVSHQPLV